jgi:hypothetical protein
MKHAFVLATLLIALLMVETADAQRYVRQSFDQLEELYNDSPKSFKNYVFGYLDEGGEDTWTFNFPGGNSYDIIAVCDEDCSDVDLEVLDEDGDSVASDYQVDDVAEVSFSTRKGERYTIKVKMYECSAEPCYFGLGILTD